MKKNNANNYKISTIIPVYNQEKYIEKALKSIANQTFQPYEILIINDASTDKTQDKYMENNEELNIELEYLKNGEIERFYDIINKKLNM